MTPEALENFSTGLTSGSLLNGAISRVGGEGLWAAPYYLDSLIAHHTMLGAKAPLHRTQGAEKEFKLECGLALPDELLTLAAITRMGSAPQISLAHVSSEQPGSQFAAPRSLGSPS